MTKWLNQCHFGDVRDVLHRMIADGVKLQTIVTSPPYWGLRSYLPADHPDKGREINEAYKPLQDARLRQPSLCLEAA